MQIQEWGEEGLIQYLSHCFATKNGVIGIGDDCAVIPIGNEEAWLVTTDALIEGVHFLKEQINPEDLGYKTMVVNVSDVVAMGGAPQYAFLSLALPSNVTCEWMHQVLSGIKAACDRWNIQLLGGDTVGSKRDIFLNLTLIGIAPQKQIKYRNQAQAGDLICVTGYLGNSVAGLQVLKEKLINNNPEIDLLLQSHFCPKPHIQEGLWLGKQPAVHAMMDVSDGLDPDLKRLLKSSQKGALVDIAKLPLSTELVKTALKYDWDPLQLALTGGEDYCLLVTVDPNEKHLFQRFFETFETPLYEIGQITNQTDQLEYQENGTSIRFHFPQFNHFSKFH